MRNFIKIPFLLFIIFYLLFSLSSCSILSEEKKVEAQKQVLTEHLQEKVQEQKNKFDKSKSREKIEWFTWFLCSTELLTHSWTNIEVESKNCLWEKNNDSVNFVIDWNILYKNINKSKKAEVLKFHKNDGNDTVAKFIKNTVIWAFPNNLERIYCNPIMNKKLKLMNKDFPLIYDIAPYWLYRQESNEQIKKVSSTKICNWYYNPDKWIILSSKKWDMILEVLKTDNLINLNNIKINYK